MINNVLLCAHFLIYILLQKINKHLFCLLIFIHRVESKNKHEYQIFVGILYENFHLQYYSNDVRKSGSRREGWGSAEATEMVLNNLFYITANVSLPTYDVFV